MARLGVGLNWLNEVPTQEQLDALEPRPPFQLDPEDDESKKDQEPKDEKPNK